MSGGFWNYKNNDLATEIFGWHIDCRYDDITEKQSRLARQYDPFGDKEVSELIHDVFCVMHAYDYKHCGDIGDERYDQTLSEFKEKWFHRTDEDRVDALKQDLREYCEELIKQIG